MSRHEDQELSLGSLAAPVQGSPKREITGRDMHDPGATIAADLDGRICGATVDKDYLVWLQRLSFDRIEQRGKVRCFVKCTDDDGDRRAVHH